MTDEGVTHTTSTPDHARPASPPTIQPAASTDNLPALTPASDGQSHDISYLID